MLGPRSRQTRLSSGWRSTVAVVALEWGRNDNWFLDFRGPAVNVRNRIKEETRAASLFVQIFTRVLCYVTAQYNDGHCPRTRYAFHDNLETDERQCWLSVYFFDVFTGRDLTQRKIWRKLGVSCSFVYDCLIIEQIINVYRRTTVHIKCKSRLRVFSGLLETPDRPILFPVRPACTWFYAVKRSHVTLQVLILLQAGVPRRGRSGRDFRPAGPGNWAEKRRTTSFLKICFVFFIIKN